MANWTAFRANDKPGKLFEFISGFFAPASALVRASEPLSLVYTDDDDPDLFIDKRGASFSNYYLLVCTRRHFVTVAWSIWCRAGILQWCQGYLSICRDYPGVNPV